MDSNFSLQTNFLEIFADLFTFLCLISQLQVTRPKTDTLRRFLGVSDKHLTY